MKPIDVATHLACGAVITVVATALLSPLYLPLPKHDEPAPEPAYAADIAALQSKQAELELRMSVRDLAIEALLQQRCPR